MAKTHELQLAKENGLSWVAVAFSKDKELGKDLVLPCTNALEGAEVTNSPYSSLLNWRLNYRIFTLIEQLNFLW